MRFSSKSLPTIYIAGLSLLSLVFALKANPNITDPDGVLSKFRTEKELEYGVQAFGSLGETVNPAEWEQKIVEVYQWDKDEMINGGWGLDNPAYLAAGNVVSALTNVPIDRGIKKMNKWVPRVSEKWDGGIPATLIVNSSNYNFYPNPFEKEELVSEIQKVIN